MTSPSAPKLSIIMPAYNHEKFVGEAVEGVLNQTFSDFEFIIVDDGSQDTTADIINSYKDDRIHYYYQENQDAFNALNNGMAKANGEFWAILNSDDVYLPKRFETLFAFQAQHNADCLFTDVFAIDDDSKPLDDVEFGWNQWHQKNRQKYFELNDLYAGFLHGNFMVTTSNLFMKSSLANKVGGFAPLRYLHDYDYIFRLMLASPKGCFYLDDEQLLKYRIHGNNTLSEGAILAREQDQTVIRQYMLAAINSDITDNSSENANAANDVDSQSSLTQKRVETGLNRLIALEHELLQVHAELAEKNTSDTVPQSFDGLKRAVKRAARRVIK